MASALKDRNAECAEKAFAEAAEKLVGGFMMDTSALNRFNWNDFTTCHGTASHLPAAILGLLSENENTRHDNYWLIDNYVVNQSDLSDSAYPVTVVLCELLKNGVVNGRFEIYQILYEIANGFDYGTRVTIDGNKQPLRQSCIGEMKKYVYVFTNDSVSHEVDVALEAIDLLELLEEHP